MALNLTPVHIKSKRPIGKLKTNPIFEVLTTGGLYLNILGKGGEFEVIATGPHQGVARYIAEQRYPDIQWNELSKSDFVEFVEIAYLLPKYEEFTDRIRSLHVGLKLQTESE